MLSAETIKKHKTDKLRRMANQHVAQIRRANKPALLVPRPKK